MSVAQATRVLMFGISIVGVLERRLGECEHEARDDAEMKHLPHEPSLYMHPKKLTSESGMHFNSG